MFFSHFLGTAISLTGVGAIVGVSLLAAGSSLAGAGEITLGGGKTHEIAAKKKQLEGPSKHLQADYFNFMQLKILVGRATNDENFANKCNIPIHDAESALGVLGEIVNIADNIITIASSNISGGDTSTGLNIAGIVTSAVSIPIDLIQLIESSIKLHRKDKSAVVKYMEKLADDLENELWLLLKDKGYTLVEIEQYDKENRKHCLLLAVEENSVHENSEKVNVSLEDIYKNQVVIADCIGEEIDPLLYEKLLTKWASEGENEKKKDRNEDDGKQDDGDNGRNEDDEVRNEEDEEEKKRME